MSAELRSWAHALGGDVSGSGVNCPGPGRSPNDRSLSVTPSATAPSGFLVHSFSGDDPIACLDYVSTRLGLQEFKPNGHAQPSKKTYFDYHDAHGALVYQVERTDYYDGRKKKFSQRRPDPARPDEWLYNLGDVRPVPYRLPDLLNALGNWELIIIAEGERCVDLLRKWGFAATCNSGGYGNCEIWTKHAEYFRKAKSPDVVILPDNDNQGRDHANTVAAYLKEAGATVRVLAMPSLPNGDAMPPKGDVIDWQRAGGTREQLRALIEREARPWAPIEAPSERIEVNREAFARNGALHRKQKAPECGEGVSLDDFHAFMEMHTYIFTPSGAMWPAASVNSRIPPIPLFKKDGEPLLDEDGNQKKTPAAAWLDKHRPVETMTWAPGEPMLISDRLISDGGWISRKGVTCFNLYRPPLIIPRNGAEARRWLDHADKVSPGDAEHIVKWLAHRVQHPEQKINHALILGGNQGVGKDTLLEPVKRAIGPWNFLEVSPQQTLEPYNGFLKSVILRVNEARDLGDVDRFKFYDHMKAYTAAPPDVLRVNEKYLKAHYVFNCTSVIITSNHKADGIFLPADDRRHFVAWSDLTKEDFPEGYWNTLWNWYEHGGFASVAAYLAKLDISGFDPKAPPPKTPAFWDIVDASRAPEDAELADVLDEMGNPDATTLIKIGRAAAGKEIEAWLKDRKNRRLIPHRLEKCGYVPVRNDFAKDGFWKIGDARQVIYVKSGLPVIGRIAAANKLMGGTQEGLGSSNH